jgi:hypothetical protein
MSDSQLAYTLVSYPATIDILESLCIEYEEGELEKIYINVLHKIWERKKKKNQNFAKVVRRHTSLSCDEIRYTYALPDRIDVPRKAKTFPIYMKLCNLYTPKKKTFSC